MVEHVIDLKDSYSIQSIVSFDKLEFLPGIIKTGNNAVDQVVVSSRLDNLEKGQEVVMKLLKQIQDAQIQVNIPANNVDMGRTIHMAPSIQVNDIVATTPAPGSLNTFNQSRNRSTSASSKRSRSETEKNENTDMKKME